MNPARSLAPAVVSGQLQYLGVYLAAPVLGALMAVPGCRCVQEEGCCSLRLASGTSNCEAKNVA